MSSSTDTTDTASLLAATRRGDYVVRVSEVIQHMLSVRDPVRAVEILCEATRRMGVEASVFASLIPEAESRRSYRLLLACDPIRLAELGHPLCYEVDPWLAYAQKHAEPIRSSEAGRVDDTAIAALELAQRFGFRSAVVVPAPSGGGLSRAGVLCLGSSRPDYFDDDGYVALKVVARGVAMELHDWWIHRLGDDLISTSGITPEDLALLRQELLGHSSKTIARRLGVSISSVDSRFQRLNARLGTRSRKTAARLVAEYGLI